MIPLTSLAFRWIFHLALISAGLTTDDALEYLARVRHSDHRGRFLDGFIIGSSSDPKRTSRLLTLHHLHVFIIAFCIIVPPIGTFTSTFEGVLRWGAVLVPVIIAAVAATGFLFVSRKGITIPTLWEDFRALAYTLNEHEVKQFERSHSGSKANMYTLGFLKLILAIGVIFGLFFLIIHAAYNPKTPATVDQVQQAILEQGYMPADMTQEYRDAWEAGELLSAAIVAEQDDVRFDFFVFDTADRALNIAGQYRDIIRSKSDNPVTDDETRNANYYIYNRTADGTYYLIYCVDSTLLYAYCAEENAGIISDVLISIGYKE